MAEIPVSGRPVRGPRARRCACVVFLSNTAIVHDYRGQVGRRPTRQPGEGSSTDLDQSRVDRAAASVDDGDGLDLDEVVGREQCGDADERAWGEQGDAEFRAGAGAAFLD